MTYGLENRCSIQLSYGCISLLESRKDIIYAVIAQIYFGISANLLSNSLKIYIPFLLRIFICIRQNNIQDVVTRGVGLQV